MSAVYWIMLLFAAAAVVGALEMFLPSGGLLGGLSAILALSGVVMLGSQYGPLAGVVSLIATIGVGMAMAVAAIKVWPHTSSGRQMMLAPPSAEEIMPTHPERDLLHSLVGKTGKATSMLLPGGAVEVDGHMVTALSEGLAIDAGAAVRVIGVRGGSVMVRPVEADEASLETPAGGGSPLSQSLESLGLDGFEPLGPPSGSAGSAGS